MQMSSIAGNNILEHCLPWAVQHFSAEMLTCFSYSPLLSSGGVAPEHPASCGACQLQCHMTRILLFFLLSPYLCSCSLLIQSDIPLHLESWSQGKMGTVVSCCLSGPKSSFRHSQDTLLHLPLSYKIHSESMPGDRVSSKQ
jgi:hypothetical protein